MCIVGATQIAKPSSVGAAWVGLSLDTIAKELMPLLRSLADPPTRVAINMALLTELGVPALSEEPFKVRRRRADSRHN